MREQITFHRAHQSSLRAIWVAIIALVLVLTPLLTIQGTASGIAPRQDTPSLDCRPLAEREPEAVTPPTNPPAPPAAGPAQENLTSVTVGYVPISIYAPIFVAKELGYFAEAGLDVRLEAIAGGSDMIVLTASGEFDFGTAGAGPAFWNALALDLPVTVIAPGHQEGSPVATPLMISREACESGDITRVSDLRGRSVSVNAPGATEFWLGAALATDGLTLDDVNQQFLAFDLAVAALSSGAIDAAMIGEPLATQAERQGIGVRLLDDFPVQNEQPTVILANNDFLRDNPDAAVGFTAAYLKASTVLNGPTFKHPDVLAIIEEYTGVPVDLASAAVQPVYDPEGTVDFDALNDLQQFFRERGQLEYTDNLDPRDFADTTFVERALATRESDA